MIDFLIYGIVLGLSTSFSLIVFHKLGVIEILQIYAPNDFWYKLTCCNFCMGFWISSIISILFGIIAADPMLLLLPVISSPIVKAIV